MHSNRKHLMTTTQKVRIHRRSADTPFRKRACVCRLLKVKTADDDPTSFTLAAVFTRVRQSV